MNGRLTIRPERWLERIRGSRHVLWALAVASFLETIIVPVPIELILVPLMAVCRDRAWRLAHAALAGCLAASLLGYGVGAALYETVGRWFVSTMGYGEAYEAFRQLFDRHGFVAILLVGILPIPFQVAMISAGLSGYPLGMFVLAAVLARGVRYYGLAWLVLRFGDRAKALWERHALATALGAAAVVLGVYVVADRIARQLM